MTLKLEPQVSSPAHRIRKKKRVKDPLHSYLRALLLQQGSSTVGWLLIRRNHHGCGDAISWL